MALLYRYCPLTKLRSKTIKWKCFVFNVLRFVSKLLSYLGFAERVLQIVLSTVLCFTWAVEKQSSKKILKEFERHFCTKIIVVIIPTNLVTSLHRNQKQELNFQQVGDLEVFPFLVYSESSSTLKVYRIQYFF